MGKYAKEPKNPTKSCKARGSNLRVHFKVYYFIHVNFTLLLLDEMLFSIEHERDS